MEEPATATPPLPEEEEDVEAQAVSNNNDNEDEPKSGSALTLAAVAKLKVKAMRWARPHVENFEDMNLADFIRFGRQNPDVLKESVLGPTSMKHPTWKGSDDPPAKATCVPLSILLIISLLVSLGVGLAVGLTVNSSGWGVGSALIVLGVAFVTFFISLVTYMACYGNGLHNPPMINCVERGGFPRNMRANYVCRYIMTCCFNPCEVGIVGCIMNGEADNAYKQIQKSHDGQGPPPGGVCWLGDSEFTFWHHLEEQMKEFDPIHINAGFGGSRIVDIQKNVNRLCLDWEPSTVIVHASGNDYDFDQGITAKEIPEKLVALFETIAAHPSVIRIGYMLSSRRPVYGDAKWDFMVRVHTMTLNAISKSPALRNKVKVLDLRANVWPLDHFVAVDRVHLNDTGHYQKSQILLPKMLAVWPKSKDADATASDASPDKNE